MKSVGAVLLLIAACVATSNPCEFYENDVCVADGQLALDLLENSSFGDPRCYLLLLYKREPESFGESIEWLEHMANECRQSVSCESKFSNSLMSSFKKSYKQVSAYAKACSSQGKPFVLISE